MTQTQLNWMQDNGYDPEQYDMDLNGNVLKRQAAVAEEDQREVMSMPRAFGTSFLGNLLPTGGAMAASAPFLPLAASAPPIGIPLMLGAGLLGGYGTGKLQQAGLERFAPEALEEMQRAETDQPVASYLGGFAPNALTMRPSVKGLSGLLRPTVRGEETLRAALSNPNFLEPAINVGANVAGSTAGQLLDMSQGGEFSAPRFAADVALGTLFNKPTGLGKRLGFQDTPENIQEAPGDLAKARDRAEFMANVPKDFITPRAERGAQDIVKPGVNIGLEAPDQYFTAEGKPLTEKAYAADYSKWWKSETEPTTELLKAKAEEVKAKIPRDKLKELSNDPEVGEVLRDTSKMEAFVAKQADQTLEDVFQMMESRKAEEISRTEKARVEAEQNAIEIKKLQDLEASQALSDEAAARLQVLKSRRAELLYANKDQGPLQLKNIREQSDPAIAQAQKEVADARAIAEDIWTRLQRPEGKQSNKITQEDINLATELANRRGLKVQLDRAFAGSQEVRGMYLVDKNTGDRIIRINPLMATADTAIHEIGHDIFKGVTNKGMRRSLMDTAMDSPAYKAELAARAEEVRTGKITEQGARDIALEEGLIQAFGEKMPDINRGELRAWFSAFKASMKQLVTGKMSPEDALAWMHYATTENVPWKGVATAKVGDVGGEERLQRALENDSAYIKAVESGDMETAQRMVNEAAKAAGYNEGPLYHVGKSSWTEADRPVYTQDSKELADKFLKSLRRDYPEAQAKKLYAQMENPAVQGRDIERSSFLTSSELGKEQLAEAMGKGFDSVKGYYAGLGVPEYLTTKPNQIKLADPVTYDNAGNVIPLSERFNKQSSDTRYQRAQQETPEFKNWFGESQVVDEQGKPLVVYHGTRSPEDFNTFRTDTGHNYGPGAYFTPEARRASGYAKENEGARVYSTYVKVEKPYIVQSDATVQDLGYRLRQDPANDALIQSLVSRYGDKNNVGNADVGNAWLRSQGYDGIIKQRNRYTENGYVPEVVEVVAFNPTQIKSATGNRGTFDPSNPDIRYQRSLLSKIQTPSELDYLVTKGGPFAEVGTTIKAAANTRDFKQGQWSSKYSLTNALPEEARVRLLNHLAGEFDSGVRSTPAADIRAAYDQLRNEYLPAIVSDYNNAGFTVRDTAGQRARGSNPTYIPLHAIADEVKTILTTLQGSPEYKKLENDFKQWNTQLRQADGATLQEAQNYANEKFEEKIQITAKTPGIESGIPFSGARKPEGYPLPPSWRSTDLISNLDNYTKRSATDFAYQKHVESSPEAMAALGAKTMVNNQPIPANILAATPNVINNDSVQSVLREYRGTPAQKNEGVLSGIGRSVSAATIGPVSKVGDIGTSLIKGLVYMPAGEYTSGLIDFTNRLGDWAALKERSYASGLNKRDAAQNMRQVLGIAEDSVNFMDKVARVISKGTGLNQLESVARTVAQAWGETVVKYNKTLALGGDKNALQMLDTLSPDWRTRSDADLSAQVGRLLQGSYDMRQLPASVLEGAAAPYLTWSKWSIGQYDSFVKYAMKPAMQGNVKPLIGQMLIGVLGGGAVSAVQEWLNNRQGKDISWKELESWMQQNQGQLGADGGQLLAQKLLTMAQKLGTFGFAGDIAKMTVDAASGGSAQGIATMPALDAIYDVSKRAAAAAKALDDGEDFGLVLQALLKDSVIGHMQVARVARNWLDEDENLRYDDRRSRRLYDELSGLPSKGGAFAVNYSNLSEREFERGDITEKTGEEAMSLVMRARQEATSPEDYASRIRKLKTSQNQIMPSMERQPQKAARYLSFVEGAEPGKGSETLKRYYTRQNEDKYRKSLIEGMSGIR